MASPISIKKDQKVLVKPRFIAFHEEGGIALAEANSTVVVGRLSYPVGFTSPASFGQPGKKPTPRDLADGGKTPHRRPAHQARFESPAGLGFLAREVVILADTQRNELRVLHIGKDKCVYLMCNGMRRLFRMGKRLRELMVRSRMKQAVSMPYNTQNREHLTVENDDDASRGEDFRLSCNLPLLRAGDILLERVVTQATHDSDDDTGADDDGAPTSQAWGLMRVVEDKARPSTISTACEVLAVDGVWDERSQGYVFVDRQRTDRKLVEFGCFYATKSSIHVSGLFVVNASGIFHGEVCGEDGATADCNIARFSENQVRFFFDRVA